MRRIETLFLRDPQNLKLVTKDVNPEVEWVLRGEGIATRKWDGTACFVRDGILYKRLHWSESKGPAPAGWLHWTLDPEAKSGHGWLPVGDGPEDKWHREVTIPATPPEGQTFELIGPRIQSNAEGLQAHTLRAHGDIKFPDAPRTWEGIRQFLTDNPMEGLVWHRPNGEMAKIKSRDFGIPWPPRR